MILLLGVVEALKVITAEKSRRIAKFAFDYATKHGRKKVGNLFVISRRLDYFFLLKWNCEDLIAYLFFKRSLYKVEINGAYKDVFEKWND